jgi:hypothetical protein
MISREVAVELVGKGWSGLVNRYFAFVDVINDYPGNLVKQAAKVVLVNNARGMLHIVAEIGPNGDSIIQEMLDKLAWAIERDSAKVCEVCGEKGFRRKAIEGSPNRCQPHYIELVNEMAEAGEI